MSRRLTFILATICLIVAVVVGLVAWTQYDTLISTAAIVVPARTIPPYTIITAHDLTTRELPRTLLREPIYREARELVGRLSTITLRPGHLVYQDQAVRPGQFRYTDDPALTVLSFPIRPDRAVGGASPGRGVQIGQRIDVYRMALAAPEQASERLTADQLLTRQGAAVECLATDVLVVDIAGSSGEEAGGASASQADSELESSARLSSSSSRVVPLSIITVVVSPTVAAQIIQAAGEEREGDYLLWVALSPLERPANP
ncbi:MAG: SAF domain-containing protein [Chloroflexi bacterium]|nr:SAF domain-containing protein [Chloroflexota bacterium]